MKKLIDELRRGWQGISQPSLLFSTTFAAGCLALATIARWGVAQIRPDVFFTPYFPAVFLAAAVGGARIGIATAIASGVLGVIVNFGSAVADPARFALLLMFWAVCGFAIWGVEHYRTIVAQQRENSNGWSGSNIARQLEECSIGSRQYVTSRGCIRCSEPPQICGRRSRLPRCRDRRFDPRWTAARDIKDMLPSCSGLRSVRSIGTAIRYSAANWRHPGADLHECPQCGRYCAFSSARGVECRDGG